MLTFVPLLIAAVDPLSPSLIPEAQPTKLFGLAVREIILILGIALILGLLLFFRAYFTHKTRRHRHSGLA